MGDLFELVPDSLQHWTKLMKQPALTDATLDFDAGGVATLKFCREDVLNALTGTNLIDDIINTLDWQMPALR